MHSTSVFALLILGFIPISISYIFGTLLTAKGKLKQLNYIALIAVIINLSMNFMLIPVIEARGAAISCLVTQTIVCILQISLCQYLGLFQFKNSDFMRFVYLLLFSIATVFFVHYFVGEMLVGVMFSGVVICIFGMAIGILPVSQVKKKFAQFLRHM